MQLEYYISLSLVLFIDVAASSDRCQVIVLRALACLPIVVVPGGILLYPHPYLVVNNVNQIERVFFARLTKQVIRVRSLGVNQIGFNLAFGADELPQLVVEFSGFAFEVLTESLTEGLPLIYFINYSVPKFNIKRT